ncbi:MAG: hypothetical protein Q4B26_19860, partial [Eubacteriales bacterium]|nr:hypothetical protein [Eubacteriales bacterium]
NAIQAASVSDDERAPTLYAEYLIDRAVFLIRMQGVEREQLMTLLDFCRKNIEDLQVREPEIEIAAHLAYMWFYTIYDESYVDAIAAWRKAKDIAQEISYPDLEKIDAILVPRAEIEVDFGHHDKSIEFLKSGIEICEKHSDSVPYLRKKAELLDHIQDVKEIKGE